MAGVGGDGLARVSVPVQGDGVEALILHPEPVFHEEADLMRLILPGLGAGIPHHGADFTHGQPGGVGVALNLEQGDRSLREAAILVEDGIFRILPALV